MSSKKYIRAYDNVITEEYCQHLISKFDSNKDLWVNRDEEVYNFQEIDFGLHANVFSDEVNELYSKFEQAVALYKQQCEIEDWMFDQKFGFESIRMKKYLEGQGEFRPHTDANNHESSKRFLVFFLYLDEGEGGETVFLNEKIKVQRSPGRLLMFPPMWTYPHAGLIPTKNDKHIIGSYLHFVP